MTKNAREPLRFLRLTSTDGGHGEVTRGDDGEHERSVCVSYGES